MMPENNPFLEGYISAIPGKGRVCPYEEGTTEYERWCRGSGGVAMIAAPKKAAANPALEGRRPYVEGYKAAILGKRDVCPYAEGTADYERWSKGFRGWAGTKGITWDLGVKKTITTPFLEGRRPYVEGYRAAILGNAIPHEDVAAEYERWSKGAPWWAVAKNAGEQPAYR